MEIVFRIILFVSGIINLLPSILAFLPQRISRVYGIVVPDSSYELLLRHRAVLFAVVGGFLVYSAFMKQHYSLSVAFGLISMISFVLLYFLVGPTNMELKKVMQIDIIASVFLAGGFLLYKLYG